MKHLIISMLMITLSSTGVFASPIELGSIRQNLEGSLNVTTGRKTLVEMNELANSKNTDVEIAIQNYLQAKERINVAKAAFNPITTGHILGIALGLNYLWAPIAIEAVLSIPMKIYNVKTNKYLAIASNYNVNEAHNILNNEMAHLYFDILTHEIILKSIDQEMQILALHQTDLSTRVNALELQSRIQDTKKSIINLNLEHINIANLYNQELAAMRTLLSTDVNGEKFELSHIAKDLDEDFLNNLDQEKLANLSLVKSDKHKMMINILNAAKTNVKSTKWSILSFSGLNLSYRGRVQDAKIENNIASLKKDSSELTIKNSVYQQLQKLQSSMKIASNYNSISNDSWNFFGDTYEQYKAGLMSEDDAVETSLGAIHDFRSKVISHYDSLSTLNDLSTATNIDLKTSSSVQSQVEKDEYYDLSSADFKVVKTKQNDRWFTVALVSEKIEKVQSVVYHFNDAYFTDRTSKNDKADFRESFNIEEVSISDFSGTATVILENGFEFNINFNL